MNQEKIGKFIAACRKEKGFTQMQLAEELNITNRAVSKWETGKSLPDISIMVELAKIFDISVNELIAGEKIDMIDYKEEAQKNIISLMMSLKELKVLEIVVQVLMGIGIFLAISSVTVLSAINHKVVFSIIGIFIWAFAIFLKVKIRKTIDKIEKR